jgi:hypothetical protein
MALTYEANPNNLWVNFFGFAQTFPLDEPASF